MNILKLSWAYLKAKPLSSLLSVLLLAMAIGIISLLLMLNKQFEGQFTKNIKGVDMVLGAKGSPLQLILSSIYHIDAPTGNISYKQAKGILKNPLVEKGIPLAYGDAYKGYRIVGTNQLYPQHYNAQIKEGREWEKDFEVSIGANTAENLGLKIGDQFFSSHGLLDDTHKHESQAYTVCGIYERSNTVIDQLILGSIASVWKIHDESHHEHGEHDSHEHHEHDGHEHHEHDGHEHHEHDGQEHHEHDASTSSTTEVAESVKAEPDNAEITAMLVKFRSPMGLMQLPRMVNEQTPMMAALPSIEVNRLFSLFGVGMDMLKLLAYTIMFISAISVFVSLFNSLKEQRYELALMRSMGASRAYLFALIVLEGLVLALLGLLSGILLSRIGLYVVSNFVKSDYHYNLSVGGFVKEELYLFGITLILGIVAAVIPAIMAYRTDIAKTLSAN